MTTLLVIVVLILTFLGAFYGIDRLCVKLVRISHKLLEWAYEQSKRDYPK